MTLGRVAGFTLASAGFACALAVFGGAGWRPPAGFCAAAATFASSSGVSPAAGGAAGGLLQLRSISANRITTRTADTPKRPSITVPQPASGFVCGWKMTVADLQAGQTRLTC